MNRKALNIFAGTLVATFGTIMLLATPLSAQEVENGSPTQQLRNSHDVAVYQSTLSDHLGLASQALNVAVSEPTSVAEVTGIANHHDVATMQAQLADVPVPGSTDLFAGSDGIANRHDVATMQAQLADVPVPADEPMLAVLSEQ